MTQIIWVNTIATNKGYTQMVYEINNLSISYSSIPLGILKKGIPFDLRIYAMLYPVFLGIPFDINKGYSYPNKFCWVYSIIYSSECEYCCTRTAAAVVYRTLCLKFETAQQTGLKRCLVLVLIQTA